MSMPKRYASDVYLKTVIGRLWNSAPKHVAFAANVNIPKVPTLNRTTETPRNIKGIIPWKQERVYGH